LLPYANVSNDVADMSFDTDWRVTSDTDISWACGDSRTKSPSFNNIGNVNGLNCSYFRCVQFGV